MKHTKITLFVLAASLFSCTGQSTDDTALDVLDPYDVTVGPYAVDIRWTTYGIPHILAEDYGSLGFGMGYALAKDHICTLADQIIKVRSERSKYFGAGDDNEHINSDFGWLGLSVVSQAEKTFSAMPENLQSAVIGYAAGYNTWLAETGKEGLPSPCRNADWVIPVTHIDLMAHYLHLGQFGSGYPFVDYVATAMPPSNDRQRTPPPISTLDVFLDPPIASNGWAIGSALSSNGKGLLVSNTHFPDAGERQWHESHLTIPGKLNVYGSSLVGVPLINVGFNETIAWTHTVSNTPRFTLYQLDVDPNDPTRYLDGNQYVSMESTTYSIEVLQEDGTRTPTERILYRTHYGPMINAPVFGWSKVAAFTYRDVNEGNYRMSNSWFAMNHATDLDSFKAAHRDHMGIPWVHTMMADAEGNAFYTDSAATPNLSSETEAAFIAFRNESPYAKTFWEYGLWMGKGGDPTYDWTNDPRSPTPGAIPFDDTPQLLRTDFVSNANENYWLANPYEPLADYPAIYGPTGTARTPRTKMNNRYLMDKDARGYAGEDALWTVSELEHAVLDASGSIADSLLSQVVTRCTGVNSVIEASSGQEVNIEGACAVLMAWDGRDNIDAVGAILWREMIGSTLYSNADLTDKGQLFEDAFDPENPIYTPNSLALNTGEDWILQSMAKAILTLEKAGLNYDVRLGDVQYRQRGDHRVPVSGGPYFAGVIAVGTHSGGGDSTLLPVPTRGTVINGTTDLTDEGYLINNGNSWVMVMGFDETGPVARAAMTYSQSEDPDSPYFKDQSELYATETLRDVAFTESDIAKDSVNVLHLERDAGTY